MGGRRRWRLQRATAKRAAEMTFPFSLTGGYTTNDDDIAVRSALLNVQDVKGRPSRSSLYRITLYIRINNKGGGGLFVSPSRAVRRDRPRWRWRPTWPTRRASRIGRDRRGKRAKCQDPLLTFPRQTAATNLSEQKKL